MRAALDVSGARRAFTLLVGEKMVEEWLGTKAAAKDRFQPVRWLRLEGRRMHPCERRLPLDTYELTEKLMRDVSDSASPPSIALLAALADEPSGPISDKAIVPWGVQDPGNLGAIIRSAAAFGFQEALLGPGCADPFSPKALRGSMGAAFMVSLRRLKKRHFDDGRWIALDSAASALPIEEVDLNGQLRLMVGCEGHGWRDADLPSGCIRTVIQTSSVESLNVAVAVGIACFEAARRRKGI
jgi:TrmH family RNA methyltransferase